MMWPIPNEVKVAFRQHVADVPIVAATAVSTRYVPSSAAAENTTGSAWLPLPIKCYQISGDISFVRGTVAGCARIVA